MPKINEYINNKKPVEIVQEVNENNWWQEKQTPIKKFNLSPSARSKIISKSYINKGKLIIVILNKIIINSRVF